MKKIIISILLIMLCAGCGIGAFFFLRKGNLQYEQEQNSGPELKGLSDIVIEEGGMLPDSVYCVKAARTVKDLEIDVSLVDTEEPGAYPIYYTYAGSDGKRHKEEIQCTVRGREGQETADRTGDVPESGTLGKMPETDIDGVLPKTGDEGRMLLLAAIAALSLAAVARTVKYKAEKARKI